MNKNQRSAARWTLVEFVFQNPLLLHKLCRAREHPLLATGMPSADAERPAAAWLVALVLAETE